MAIHNETFGGYRSAHEIPSSETRLWIASSDVRITAPVLVKRRSIGKVKLLVDPKSHLFSTSPSDIEKHASSMRSRNAQEGLDVEDFGKRLRLYLDVVGISLSDEPIEAEIPIENYCERPVFLPKGAAILRPYAKEDGSRIIGKELLDLQRQGKIRVEGKEGEDWKWLHTMNRKDIDSMAVRINGNRRWIPPHSRNEPVYVDPEGNSYRAELDTYLEPIPQTDRKILWIGETEPTITLSEDTHGILHSAVAQNINGRGSRVGAHINSHLIYGGRTNWRIRVEVLSDTLPGSMPNYVIMYFVRG